MEGLSQRVSEADLALLAGHIEVIASAAPFPFQRTRKTPHTSAWLPRHLHNYALNIGLSVLDVPGECIDLFVMAMGEGILPAQSLDSSNGYPTDVDVLN